MEMIKMDHKNKDKSRDQRGDDDD